MSSGSLAIMQISTLKSTLANNTALDAAEVQRELINEQRDLRSAQATFERLIDDGHFSEADRNTLAGLEAAVGIDLNQKGVIGNASGSMTGHLEAQGDDPSQSAVQAAANMKAHVDVIKKSFDDALKDLEAQDRLGNHEIQRLMQTMNQSDTLQANVAKKDDDRESGVIGKI